MVNKRSSGGQREASCGHCRTSGGPGGASGVGVRGGGGPPPSTITQCEREEHLLGEEELEARRRGAGAAAPQRGGGRGTLQHHSDSRQHLRSSCETLAVVHLENRS